MSGTTNQGVVGYISNPVASFPKNSLTIDIFGNAFYRNYIFGAGDDTGVYWNEKQIYTPGTMLFFVAAISTAIKGKYSYGYKLRSSQSLDFAIRLPQTEAGDINFAFMESCLRELEESRLRELEESRLRELETYLIASGLKDYHLSATDHASLDAFAKTRWRSFNIQKLFGKSTRGKRLKGEDRTPGSFPFVTAGEANTGISAFIGNQVEVFMRNTTTIDMFGSAKYRNYNYGADDHVAVVHTESLPKNAAIFVTASCHKAAHTGKFDYGHNFYAKDADELNVMLPVRADGQPDIDEMEHLIAAIHKMVIADVAKFTSRELSTTRQVVDENRLDTVVKKRVIHKNFKPGFIPLYSLRAACGRFEDNEVPEVEGWIDASGLGFSPDKEKHFVIYAKGDSMMPMIHNGDLCVFEWYKGGSREGEIVLTQSRDYDPDYDGKYTIKRYHSEKLISKDNWQHTKIHLLPLNPEYDPIYLTSEDEGEYRTIGVFKAVL
jgi:SOS-response transcriptional repressor LexA